MYCFLCRSCSQWCTCIINCSYCQNWTWKNDGASWQSKEWFGWVTCTVFPRIDFALELYSPLNSIRSILHYEWNNDRPRIVFAVNACAVYASTRYIASSIHTLPQAYTHCLKQSGIAAHAASRISQLTAEMLVARDNDDNDPFLSLDDDEDELETNELIVEDMDWLHLDTF